MATRGWSGNSSMRLIIVAYGFLACRCPAGGAAVEAAASGLTATHWELVGRMEGRVRELCRAGAQVELAGGRDVLN